MSQLVETIAAELERPRELSTRVLNYISGHYGVDEEAIGSFLINELPNLEEYEVDLVLSPVFTPKLADQAVIADQLGMESLPREQWPALVRELVARPTRAQLITMDGKHHTVPLSEVTVERYVYRLRLDASIAESTFKLVNELPAGDRSLAKAVARQTVWENQHAREILEHYLSTAIERASYSLDDNLGVLNLVEARKPTSLADLIERIPSWEESLRRQVEVAAGGKPFFNEDIRLMHGEGRDQRSPDDARISAKEKELRFLGRLQQLLKKPYT